MTRSTREPLSLVYFSKDFDTDVQVTEVYEPERPDLYSVTVEVARVRFVPEPEAPAPPAAPAFDQDRIVESLTIYADYTRSHQAWQDTYCTPIPVDDDIPAKVEGLTHLGAILYLHELMARGYRCPLGVLNDLYVLSYYTLCMHWLDLGKGRVTTDVQKSREWNAMAVQASHYFDRMDYWSVTKRNHYYDMARGAL